MKLFIKEHIALTCWVVGILLTVVAVFWYDGYDHWLTAAYAVFLGLIVYIGYLTYRYMSHRAFYTRLSHQMNSLKEFTPVRNQYLCQKLWLNCWIHNIVITTRICTEWNSVSRNT